MMRTLYKIACLAWLACAVAVSAAWAVELTPPDFAWGIDITPSDNSAWQAIELPESYYRKSARKGGGDLRVYNSDTQSVPYKLEQAVSQTDHQRQQALVFFPVYGAARTDLENVSLQIQRSADGSLISIESQNQQPASEHRIIAYIIDVSKANAAAGQEHLTRLIFDWSEPEYGFINNLKIDASNDLNQWSTITSGQSLSRLDYAGQSLGKKAISLVSAAGADYLRLSWPPEQASLQLTAVAGGYEWSEVADDIPQQSLLLQITQVTAPGDHLENGAWLLDTGGHYPLQELTFAADDDKQNEYYAGQLYSRPDSDAHWVPRGEFEQFRLHSADGVVSSEAYDLYGVRAQQWLVRFNYPQHLPDSAKPQVRLTWQPERLIFIAQGQPPFTLAFGNANVASAVAAGLLDSIPADIEVSDNAQLGAAYSLGGPQPEVVVNELPRRKLLLWTVLIVGVLLMFWMASRLYQQMDQADDADG